MHTCKTFLLYFVGTMHSDPTLWYQPYVGIPYSTSLHFVWSIVLSGPDVTLVLLLQFINFGLFFFHYSCRCHCRWLLSLSKVALFPQNHVCTSIWCRLSPLTMFRLLCIFQLPWTCGMQRSHGLISGVSFSCVHTFATMIYLDNHTS